MTAFEELFELWKKYFHFYVIGNEHLERPLFHSFLGVVLTASQAKFVYSGHWSSTRVPVFIIQNSGTGKAQAMKALHFLVGERLKSSYTTKMTEAALTGTQVEIGTSGRGPSRRIETRTIYGALSTENLICWDEGGVLFSRGPGMEGVRDALNMALDEPGWVNKRLRLGDEISYPTNTTIVAGSMLKDSISESVLKEGFLQRMFILFKNFSEEELNEMDNKMSDLLKVNYEEVEKVKKSIWEKLDYLMGAVKLQYCDTLPETGLIRNAIIRIDEESIHDADELRIRLRREWFERQFSGSIQESMRSFYSRLFPLYCKIAVQYAMLNLKEKVDKECFEYAYSVVREHCRSIFDLTCHITEGTKVREHTREDSIKSLIRSEGGRIYLKVLLEKLKRFRENGSWNLGENATKKFINSMIVRKMIKVGVEGVPGGGKRYILYLPSE